MTKKISATAAVLSVVVLVLVMQLRDRVGDSKHFEVPIPVQSVRTSPDCGPSCMYAACRMLLGDYVAMSDVSEHLDVKGPGVSMSELVRAARELGLNADAVNCDASHLAARVRKPNCCAILYLRTGHFVLAASEERGTLRLLDPASGVRTIKVEEMQASLGWLGDTLFLVLDRA